MKYTMNFGADNTRTATTDHGTYTITKRGHAWYGAVFTALDGTEVQLGWVRDGDVKPMPHHTLAGAKHYVSEHAATMVG